jgi:hypothetical protein
MYRSPIYRKPCGERRTSPAGIRVPHPTRLWLGGRSLPSEPGVRLPPKARVRRNNQAGDNLQPRSGARMCSPRREPWGVRVSSVLHEPPGGERISRPRVELAGGPHLPAFGRCGSFPDKPASSDGWPAVPLGSAGTGVPHPRRLSFRRKPTAQPPTELDHPPLLPGRKLLTSPFPKCYSSFIIINH